MGAAQPVRRAAANRALQCFGVGTLELAGRRITVAGSRCLGIPIGSLAALVRSVDGRRWNDETLAHQRADREWLGSQADLHEHVLDRAMAYGTIVPLPLLTVFGDAQELERAMRSRMPRLRRLVASVGEAREWSIMCFSGPHLPPTAGPYTFRIRARPRRARLVVPTENLEIREHLHTVWDETARSASKVRLLDSGGRRGYLFGGSFLLTPAQIEPFRSVIVRRAAAALALGISTYLEGPRPPFTFV